MGISSKINIVRAVVLSLRGTVEDSGVHRRAHCYGGCQQEEREEGGLLGGKGGTRVVDTNFR